MNNFLPSFILYYNFFYILFFHWFYYFILFWLFKARWFVKRNGATGEQIKNSASEGDHPPPPPLIPKGVSIHCACVHLVWMFVSIASTKIRIMLSNLYITCGVLSTRKFCDMKLMPIVRELFSRAKKVLRSRIAKILCCAVIC